MTTTPSDEEQRKAAEAAHFAMYGARNKPGFGNYYHLPAEYLYVGASAAWSVGHEAGLAAGRAEREPLATAAPGVGAAATSPSDDDLKRIAADAVAPGLRLDHICWSVNAETHFRAIWEAAFAAGRAEKDDPTFDATDGAHPAWWRGHDASTEKYLSRMQAAEQKLAALVEGLRALCGKSSVFVTVGAIDALLQSAAPDKTTPRHNAEKEST